MKKTPIEAYLEAHQTEFKPWIVDNEQGRVDIKILPYLQHIERGVFLEAGALDGLFMSNTKLLEDLGWKGLLVEPSKAAYKKARANRRCTVENYALVGFDYNQKMVRGNFVHDGRKGLGARSHIDTDATNTGTGNRGAGEMVDVKAITLTKLLDSYKCTHVDFFSLDVEGFEMQVLNGIDWKRIDITFILIEVNTSANSLQEMDAYIKARGYTNLGCLSNFNKDNTPGWDGSHNDYLYKKT